MTMSAYNRANYHAERKQALDKWAAHIMALVTKPKAAKAGAKPDAKLGENRRVIIGPFAPSYAKIFLSGGVLATANMVRTFAKGGTR